MLQNRDTFGGHEVSLYISHKSCDCDVVQTYAALGREQFGREVVDPVNGTIAACDVPFLGRDSPLWSHSTSCSNFQYVQERQQILSTSWTMLQGLSILAIVPVCGKISDICTPPPRGFAQAVAV